jgi:GxxExxY protein
MDKQDKIELRYNEKTSLIIKAFFNVYNALGYGFTKEVYKNSLDIEFRKMALEVEDDSRLTIYYESVDVGKFMSDFKIAPSIIVQVSTKDSIDNSEVEFLYHLLRASKSEIGIFLNFGQTAEFKRKEFY